MSRGRGVGRPMVLAGLAAILVLAGCATGAADDDGAPSQASGAVTVEPDEPEEGTGRDRDRDADGPVDDGRADGDGDEELSVLGSFLGYEIPGLGAGDDMELRRLEQDVIARCMREEGFTYVAWVEDPAVIYVPVEEGLDHESRRFAETYGFGVSTQFYAQADVGPGLVGHTGDGSGVDFEENPNATIRAELSPEELLAYDRAFWGPDSPIFGSSASDGGTEDDPDGVVEAREMVANGCIGEAQRAIDGEASEVLDAFAVEILGLPTRALADDRYLANADAVERCVNEAGFDFYRHTPPWASLAHFDDLIGQFDELVGGNPFDQLDEETLAEMTAEELDALYDLPRDIPEDLLPRLAEIQDLEVRTATAVWDCGGSPADERRVLDAVMADLQAEFIEANQADLERFRR